MVKKLKKHFGKSGVIKLEPLDSLTGIKSNYFEGYMFGLLTGQD